MCTCNDVYTIIPVSIYNLHRIIIYVSCDIYYIRIAQ